MQNDSIVEEVRKHGVIIKFRDGVGLFEWNLN